MTDKKLPPITDYPKTQQLSPLKRGAVGAAELTAEIAGGYVPGINYSKEKILEKFVRGPLEEKRAIFHNRIAEGLEILEIRLDGFDPKNLSDNEDFVSAVYEATQIAMKSSREQKREYLVNAVLNIAKGFSFLNVAEGSFLQMIDRFSVHHVEVLKIYQNPRILDPVFPQGNVSIHGPMKDYIGRLLQSQGLSASMTDRIHDDLATEKMIASYELSGTPNTFRSMLKPIGEEFLSFISNPIE